VLEHFHNPLSSTTEADGSVSWNDAGLFTVFQHKSPAISAQSQVVTRPGGDWSWQTARKFYATALTGNSTNLDGFIVYDEVPDEELFGILLPIQGESKILSTRPFWFNFRKEL